MLVLGTGKRWKMNRRFFVSMKIMYHLNTRGVGVRGRRGCPHSPFLPNLLTCYEMMTFVT